MNGSTPSRRITRIASATLATAIAGTVLTAVPASAATTTLDAPHIRVYTPGVKSGVATAHVYGLNGVKGAVKYQVLTSTGGKAKVVATVKPGQVAKIKTNQFISARAVDSKGRAGKTSPLLLTYNQGANGADATRVLSTKNDVLAFAGAAVKYMAGSANKCRKDVKFMKAYSDLQKKALQTKNYVGVLGAAMAEYYKGLYNMAFANGCAELAKVGVWQYKTIEAANTAIAKKMAPVTLDVSADHRKTLRIINQCYFTMNSGRGTKAKTPAPLGLTLNVSKDKCLARVKAWVA